MTFTTTGRQLLCPPDTYAKLISSGFTVRDIRIIRDHIHPTDMNLNHATLRQTCPLVYMAGVWSGRFPSCPPPDVPPTTQELRKALFVLSKEAYDPLLFVSTFIPGFDWHIYSPGAVPKATRREARYMVNLPRTGDVLVGVIKKEGSTAGMHADPA